MRHDVVSYRRQKGASDSEEGKEQRYTTHKSITVRSLCLVDLAISVGNKVTIIELIDNVRVRVGVEVGHHTCMNGLSMRWKS